MTVQPVEVTSLVEGLLDDLQCDHRRHLVDTHAHHGNAEWWVGIHCPGCGASAEGFRCAGWREFVITHQTPLDSMGCPICRFQMTMTEYLNLAKWVKL